MRIAVLGSPNSWHFKDLRRAAPQDDVVSLPFGRLSASLTSAACNVASEGQPLKSLDAIVVRSMPPGSLEQVVFRMDTLLRCEAQGQTILNAPRALETAIDKFLCLAKLRAAGFEIPETVCLQDADQAMEAFQALDQDVVLKPLFGGEGRGITRLTDESFAFRSFRLLESAGSVIYLQRFIPHHGNDLRLLTVGPQVFGIRRVNLDDWRTNVSLGATAEPLEVTDRLTELARRAADAVGAQLCGLDLLPGKDGRFYALEVNAVPGWRALSNTLGVDIAENVIRYLRTVVSSRSGP